MHPTPLLVLAGRSAKACFGPLSYSWVVYVGAFAVGLVASRGKSRRGVPLLGAAAYRMSPVSLQGGVAVGGRRMPWEASMGVLSHFPWVYRMSTEEGNPEEGWEWGLGGFLGRAEALSDMLLPR